MGSRGPEIINDSEENIGNNLFDLIFSSTFISEDINTTIKLLIFKSITHQERETSAHWFTPQKITMAEARSCTQMSQVSTCAPRT